MIEAPCAASDGRHDPAPGLFDPLQLGDLLLPNRIVMAPMSRVRAVGGHHEPNALMAEYYAQRASAGLIVSEGVAVSPMGIGYAAVPGAWTERQVAGWRAVTEAVHRRGGRIFMQLWHVGRLSHPSLLNGKVPVSASAIAADGHVNLLRPKQPYPTPRALDVGEMAEVVEQFRRAAQNAQRAGFDGVEVHGANGYLLEQFLHDTPNRRDDEYGGCVENRSRLLLEVTDAAISVWGPDRVGVHISPRCDRLSMGDSDPLQTFGHVVRELSQRRIAFVLAREAEGADSICPTLKRMFDGTFIANEGFTLPTAEAAIQRCDADAVAFGKLFIANPDLPERLARGSGFNPLDSSTIYGSDAKGYIDYPMCS